MSRASPDKLTTLPGTSPGVWSGGGKGKVLSSLVKWFQLVLKTLCQRLFSYKRAFYVNPLSIFRGFITYDYERSNFPLKRFPCQSHVITLLRQIAI